MLTSIRDVLNLSMSFSTSSRCLCQLSRAFRPYATLSPHTPPPPTPYEVFDEPSKARQRDRALLRLREQAQIGSSESEGLKLVDYLREELAERLAERIEVGRSLWRSLILQDLKEPPSRILDLAAHAGQLTRVLQEVLAERKGEWFMVEPSGQFLSKRSGPS